MFDEGSTKVAYSVSLLEVDPPANPTTTQIILIAQFEGKTLVAVPNPVWHRSVSKRILNPQSLTKATLVEVQAEEAGKPGELLEGSYLQLWIGYLKQSLVEQVQTHIVEFDADYFFGSSGSVQLLPAAVALVAVAQEHFAFFSAGEVEMEHPDEEELEAAAMNGAGELGYADLQKRMEGLELSVAKMASSLETLVQTRAAP